MNSFPNITGRIPLLQAWPAILLLITGPACQPRDDVPGPEELCAEMLTSSLDECASLDSDCFTVTCLPTINGADSCDLQGVSTALITREILEYRAQLCDDLASAQWREWACGTGEQLVACESLD